MTDTKICVTCGTEMHDDGSNPGNWLKRKYCSQKCCNRAVQKRKPKSAPRTPEQEAAKVEHDRRAAQAYLERMKESAQKQRQRAEVRRRGRVLERTG